jgi:ATP-dependent DNA ligase
MPIDAWEAKECTLPYKDRLKLTRRIVTSHICNYHRIIDIGSDVVYSSGEVVSLYKNYLDKGFEGVMLKDLEGLYKWKRVTLRSGEVLKLKPFETLDLPIVGFYDGEGKYSGLLGGIVVQYKDTKVRVGSGFTDSDRKKMNDRDKYLGKIAEIKYLEETDNGSLRHPIFIRMRPDK